MQGYWQLRVEKKSNAIAPNIHAVIHILKLSISVINARTQPKSGKSKIGDKNKHKNLHVLVSLQYLSDESHSQRCASRYFQGALAESSIFEPRKDLIRLSSWPHKVPTFEELFSANLCRFQCCGNSIFIFFLLMFHKFAPSWVEPLWQSYVCRLNESNDHARYTIGNIECCGQGVGVQEFVFA